MQLALFLLLAAAYGLIAHRIIRLRRGRARALVVLASVALAVVALPLFAMIAAYTANQWRLARFAAQVFAYPLPPGARELRRATEYGVVDRGNVCQFSATREFASTLPLPLVRAHYERLTLRPANGDREGQGFQQLEVMAQPRGYLLLATDTGYENDFDPRCM